MDARPGDLLSPPYDWLPDAALDKLARITPSCETTVARADPGETMDPP
jgi:hypothetical protein